MSKNNLNWFVGASPAGIGNTNNITESFNARIKQEFFNEKVAIGTNLL